MNYKITILLSFLLSCYTTNSQTNLAPLHNQDTLYVSDIKTTHLLFEENIKYVDIGSPYFVADTLQQMIRLKHVGEELEDVKSQLSNLTVITKKGRFYSIYLGYDRFATPVSYEVKKSPQIVPAFKEQEEKEIKKEENMAALCSLIAKFQSNVHIANRWGEDLEIDATGIFYVDEKIGIRIHLKNYSNIDFDIDHILFRTKLHKRFSADYLYQERVIEPINICTDTFEIAGDGSLTIIFLFDKFMLNKKEKLYVDIFEKNGGRSATLCISRRRLLQPKVI
ncbi:DUF4138 domain-containing protein [Abyssalbus ytuae]|uniref:Conjugative transposon protein TraN n=1 Tax=Abyssalbus ytuae TaxID=2926907 RepID=A0A9E6ZQ31_9FLAO|nr:DUF4138 domain-containing protein [Abyssalbus ytuae]UOB18425.1 conjugative transposon protein TraN [Abyssalbus ytuae]